MTQVWHLLTDVRLHRLVYLRGFYTLVIVETYRLFEVVQLFFLSSRVFPSRRYPRALTPEVEPTRAKPKTNLRPKRRTDSHTHTLHLASLCIMSVYVRGCTLFRVVAFATTYSFFI